VYRLALVFSCDFPSGFFNFQSTTETRFLCGAENAFSLRHSGRGCEGAQPGLVDAESLARARKWWTLDCEICHNKNEER
jgi:hypothetical protein